MPLVSAISVSSVLSCLQDPAPAPSPRAKALLFHDPRSIALLRQVERLARSDATVLVQGETGTGKELIARHIHKESRRTGPFVAVNCGAFSESLIDAELFGHEAGAFTGATRARGGWFEAAQGGTLFLDEIGDLSQSLQVKLLRVLQERQVVRLGSTRPIDLDLRLVAATNVDLAGAVRAQQFRADLYYRLSVATVALPPLRERSGDILPLAEHFMSFYGANLGLSNAVLAPDARSALVAHAWPGNIRELENAVHHALIVCRNGVVHEADLHLATMTMAVPGQGQSLSFATGGIPGPRATADRYVQLRSVLAELLECCEPDLFDRVEAELVGAAYAYSGHNQVRAATALGIARNPLRTLLKRHGLLQQGLRIVAAPLDTGVPPQAASAGSVIAFGHPRIPAPVHDGSAHHATGNVPQPAANAGGM